MKLGDVMTLSKGNLISIEDDREYIIAGVQNYGAGILNKRKVKGVELTMKKYQLIRPNQLMWCKVDTKNGAFGITKIEHQNSLASTNMALADIDTSKCHPDFIEYLFRISFFHEIITKASSGTTNRKYLTPTQLFQSIEIPDLNIDEQRKWIEKVDSIVNSGISNELTNQLTLVKKLRQQLLQDAVQGKLVSQNPKDEPASELLKKIKKQKDALIKQKKLKIGRATEQSVSLINNVKIPKSWQWCKSDEIFFVTKLAGFEYSEHISLNESGEIPVVRAQNVRPLIIDKTNLLYIDAKTSSILERCALNKKCLLVTFIGAGIGDVATFEETERWHLAPNVAKMEPFEACEEFINVKYLNYYLMSKLGQREIFKHVKATAQPSLSMGTIRDIDFAIPPISEQNRIVHKLDQLMQYCNELEARIKESESQNEKLLQQVLREALSNKNALN